MVWVLILTGYENQTGGMVISIPQFRKDFGFEFGGSYVLDAKWQSAISGGPNGALCVGSFIGSWLADKFGRKWVLNIAILLTIPFVTIEYISTTILCW